MKKLKILIIPSWYPNKKDPLWGNYFIKQAESLSEFADVSMLYVNRVGLREYKELSNEKKTDGLNDTLYNFKFYKKTIINYRSLSLDYSYKKYAKEGYKAYKEMIKITGRPDVILVESILPAGLIAKYIKDKDNVPYVIHAHSLGVMENDAYKEYVTDVMKDASDYMAVNNKIKETVEKLRNKECNIVPNFIDCNKFKLKEKRKDKDFVLINICNFYKVKALDVLLKAMDIVVNKKGMKNVKLKIVGTGEYKSFYESICRSLNLNDNVEFLGYIPNNELPNILSKCDTLCVSSTFETFCIPIVEAFSTGIPVITTNCDGPLEIVDETNSIVTPINDIDGYADAIIRMIKNYKKYDSSIIREYAISNYDKKIICKKIIKILEKSVK